MRCAGLSDLGPARKRNEDRFLVDKRGLFIVADGLGGLPGGDLAAEIVVEVLPALLRQRTDCIDDLADPSLPPMVADALIELSALVRQAGEARPHLSGLGATVVLVLLGARHALVAHLGDSRVYLLRGRGLERLTTDHTLVEALIAAGEITPMQAHTHPGGGRLTRYAGMAGEALPDTRLVELRARDRLLLCSDGLTGVLDDDQIRTILTRGFEPHATCDALIAAANEAGARDNITAIVIDLSAT